MALGAYTLMGTVMYLRFHTTVILFSEPGISRLNGMNTEHPTQGSKQPLTLDITNIRARKYSVIMAAVDIIYIGATPQITLLVF